MFYGNQSSAVLL